MTPALRWAATDESRFNVSLIVMDKGVTKQGPHVVRSYNRNCHYTVKVEVAVLGSSFLIVLKSLWT